jgi:hypothetical protein
LLDGGAVVTLPGSEVVFSVDGRSSSTSRTEPIVREIGTIFVSDGIFKSGMPAAVANGGIFEATLFIMTPLFLS